jgi:pimeloyl-ACP methyl ester carboxylesterase
MSERLVEVNGVEICTEAFGDRGDPAVLLIAGMSGSMLWWDEGFCRILAGRGRFVIRYDHRDTGRSTTYEPGHPEYTAADLVADAAGVLDAYDIEAAHVAGVSMGGALAQLMVLDYPHRVLSLTLITTSLADQSAADLPPSTEEFRRAFSELGVDYDDPDSIVQYLVDYSRVLAGDRRPFDDDEWRALARREVERARDPAAAQNHGLLGDDARERPPLSAINTPTLVLQGTADPMFPNGHGEALAAAIPGAQLLRLDGAGHGLYREDWDTVADAISRNG